MGGSEPPTSRTFYFRFPSPTPFLSGSRPLVLFLLPNITQHCEIFLNLSRVPPPWKSAFPPFLLPPTAPLPPPSFSQPVPSTKESELMNMTIKVTHSVRRHWARISLASYPLDRKTIISLKRKLTGVKIKMICSFVTSVGQKKNSESQTGIEPMASQIPVGRSNH